MTLSKKTKIELISEVKKLQRKIELLKKNKTSVPTQFETPTNIFKSTKWESYFAHSENTVVAVDSKGIILDINKLAKGTKKENVIGKSAYSFVDKETLKTMKLAIASVFKSHKPADYKSKRIDEKGNSFYYSTKATPVIEHKKVVAVVLEAKDVTQAVLIKQSLIESEEKFKKLSDSAFEGVAIHKDGKIIEANKALYDTFRYTEKEIVGKPFLPFFHPDYHKKVIENIKNKVETPYEVKIFRKGGEEVWVEMLGTEIVYKGEPARVVSIRDITRYKENEIRIKESEENHKHFLQEIPSGVIIYVDSIIVFANKAAFEILDLKQRELGEVKSINIFNYILPKYQKEIKERIERVLNGEILPFWEIEVQTPNNEILDIEIKSKGILHNGKKGIQTVFNNISYRKNAEKVLKESERVLSTLMNQLPGMAYRCELDDKWTMRFVSKGA